MIETRGLGKAYGRGLYAIRNVNLNVEKGEFAFITGPSGAGKSTLLRLLLLQEKPTEGQIMVGGRVRFLGSKRYLCVEQSDDFVRIIQ